MTTLSKIEPLTQDMSPPFTAPLIEMPLESSVVRAAPRAQQGLVEPSAAPVICTRLEAEAMLKSCAADMPGAGSEALKFVDIAFGAAGQIPAWAVSEVRKAPANPLCSRYVYVPQLAEAPSEGLYHVSVLHQGGTVMVSRTSRFNGRVVHDPFSISPEEVDLANFAFLKAFAYLKSPVTEQDVAKEVFSETSRVRLASIFHEATGQSPFGPNFVPMTVTVPTVPSHTTTTLGALESTVQVSHKRRRF